MEELKWMTKKYFWKVDPLLRQTVSHADTVIAMNSGVERVLHVDHGKVLHMPSVSTEAPTEIKEVRKGEGFTVLSYTSDDPVVARKLGEAGADAIMS